MSIFDFGIPLSGLASIICFLEFANIGVPHRVRTLDAQLGWFAAMMASLSCLGTLIYFSLSIGNCLVK